MKWAIRDLLNPVVTRSLLYGANPFDVEYILKQVDAIKAMSGRKIQAVWLGEWEKKIQRYQALAEKAQSAGNRISARAYAKLVAECNYACFMINLEDIERKTQVYEALEKSYAQYLSFCNTKTEYVEIDSACGKIPAYLHFPDDGSQKSYPCVVTYSGIGSCKEELEMLAQPLKERGIAVLCPDMPGAGASVIHRGIRCGGETLDNAIDGIYAYLHGREDIDSDRLGNFGLCMGGGYAFRATVRNPQAKACVSLFPLFINFCKLDSVPIWMKKGKWASTQYCDNFYESMKQIEEGEITSDFLMVDSPDDNWMTPEASNRLYNKATGYKERIRIDEKPSYVSEETIMHAMPVGEQYHWVKHQAADFIAERLKGE
ncbi:MAG: alpha/beta hydrolase [Ruminococcus sp.]|nr:alpha/beta hydrolase [Ruminococcus sp.]